MNRFILYGFAALLFLGVMVASFDRSQINRLRTMVGLEPLYRSEAVGIREAEKAAGRIAERPVPGIVNDPPTLGAVAEAAVACVAGPDGPGRSERAEAALRRYLLALAATGLERGHPLIEPKLAGLYRLTGQGPMAALETAAQGRLTEDERALLAEFHATYRDPDHPLYTGLQLHGGTFDAMTFQKTADRMAAQWREVAECARNEALPPLAEWERLTVE